ncbi:MAG: SDR family oxidoreductase [Gallionella sp.]
MWWKNKATPMQNAATLGILQNPDPARWRDQRFGLPRSRWERLNGENFWVTGAGTGYGRCISLALAAAGAQVFITGRRAAKLQETLTEGISLGIDMGRCIPVVADITSEPSLACAVDEIRRYAPWLHGLVNSAALPQPNAGQNPLVSQRLDAWNDLMATNVTGQWLASRAALRLAGSEGFRIIFLSSEAGWASTPGFGPYNISKSAVNTLGASMAAECALDFPERDIQINVLVPGEAHTEMNQGSSQSPYAVVCMALTLLSHPRGGPNGYFFHRDGRHLAFAYTPPFSNDLLAFAS